MDLHTNFIRTLTISIDGSFDDLNDVALESYKVYFREKIFQAVDWSHGVSIRPLFILALHTDIGNIMHILSIVLSGDSICRRADLKVRFLLQQVPCTAEEVGIPEEGRASWLDGLIDLVLTLLLCLPVGRDAPLVTRRAAKTRMSMPTAQWKEHTTFQEFVASQFPEPTEDYYDEVTLPTSVLKAVMLERNLGIRVQWTHDFREHLSFDHKLHTLKIFALRYYITDLGERRTPIFPKRLIDEYNRTMDILFPASDSQTHRFLAKRRPDLVTSDSSPSLKPVSKIVGFGDFFYYREKLVDLNNFVASQQPTTSRQLWRNRRPANGLGGLLGRGDERLPHLYLGSLPRRFSGSTPALSMRTYGVLNEEDADTDADIEPTDEPQSQSADSVLRDPVQQLLKDRNPLPTIVE